jgi:hypothetical protein
VKRFFVNEGASALSAYVRMAAYTLEVAFTRSS